MRCFLVTRDTRASQVPDLLPWIEHETDPSLSPYDIEFAQCLQQSQFQRLEKSCWPEAT